MFKTKSLLLLSILFVSCLSAEDESFQKNSFLEFLSEEAFCLGTGAALHSLSLIAEATEHLNHFAAHSPSLTKECLFLKNLANQSASYFLQKPIEKKNPYDSWLSYQKELSQIPCSSKEDERLLQFLENRWLAKSTGFFPLLVNKVYPSFGVNLQVHPETSTSYARSPLVKISETYKKKMEAWKEVLPQPKDLPLILTSSADIERYFLHYIKVEKEKDLDSLISTSQETFQTSPLIIDFTPLLNETDPKKWMNLWKHYRHELTLLSEKHKISLSQILCIQKVQEGNIGGIRILPLLFTSSKKLEEEHQFLIGWISTFGLSANRIELDRFYIDSSSPRKEQSTLKEKISKENINLAITDFEKHWDLSHPQKNLMLQGALLPLKELLEKGSFEKAEQNATLFSVCELSFYKIEKELSMILQEKETSSFFTFASHIEQLHANLSSLLEILSPYEQRDFSSIYLNALSSIPKDLKPLTSCSLLSSGMASLAGVLQATKSMTGKAPQVLYGENTYYECIHAASLLSNASPLLDAKEEDFKEVDLIIAQFNPAWKGTFSRSEYREENISQTLKQAFATGREKPLVLAIDCTFDFINSPKVKTLLLEFQKEIEKGKLNVISYRSGLKFDLFGMDNYCGAPFYMVNDKSLKWKAFTDLLIDPVLETDRLSLSWFCAAYKTSIPHLEGYRREFFSNTKELLKKIPARLFEKEALYRVIPFSEGTDPAFIDITLKGPFHKFKAAILSGYLTLKCMEKGFPLFYRISIGLYHTNLSMLFGEDCSTIRLALGLDPDQIEVLRECFETLDFLSEDSFLKQERILKSSGLPFD